MSRFDYEKYPFLKYDRAEFRIARGSYVTETVSSKNECQKFLMFILVENIWGVHIIQWFVLHYTCIA